MVFCNFSFKFENMAQRLFHFVKKHHIVIGWVVLGVLFFVALECDQQNRIQEIDPNEKSVDEIMNGE